MQGPDRDYQLYLFDLDDTLTRTISGEKFPKNVHDREFTEGRLEKLLELAAAGKKTAIVTNQGGATWGIFQREEMNCLLAKLANSADIAGVFVCYHDHSEKARRAFDRTIGELTVVDVYKEWDRRKPGPGMLIEAMDFFQIDRLDTLMVGDRAEDKGAADAAGVDFQWEWEFFGDGPIIV